MGPSSTMALVEFAAERDASNAVASLAALGVPIEAEIARRTLWQDDEDDADVTSAVRFRRGRLAIHRRIVVARVFGTYGTVYAATREDGTDGIVKVRMADRRGAETAAAALSGVYRFEEGAEFPVRVTWCPPMTSGRSESSGPGEKRKRDGGEDVAGEGATLSAKQLLAVGLPATTTDGEQVASWFAAEGGACLLFDKDRRCAILAFPSADAATEALDTHGGTMRPEGNPCPVTLRRIACDVAARPKKRSAVRGPPPASGRPCPSPGPSTANPRPRFTSGPSRRSTRRTT